MSKTIHETADAVLKAVNEHLDPHAFIAGGYARDKHFGIQPKDIDIVLHVPDEMERVLNAERMITSLGSSGLSFSEAIFLKFYNGDESIDWADEVVKLKVDGHAVDLLFLKYPVSDPNKVFESFDFGICRIGIRDGKELSSEWFEKDERDQTLTLLDTARDAENLDRILLDHLPRLQAKFPAYTPVGLEKIKGDK
jgi:hypothetical protein